MSTLFNKASWVMIPSGYEEDVVFVQKPTSGGDLTFTRSSDATRTNSAGQIERVAWNLLQRSEEFDNASWSKVGFGAGIAPVVTSNAGIAPNGTMTADRAQFDCGNLTSSNNRSYILQSIAIPVGQTYSGSFYVKAFSSGEVGKQLRFTAEGVGSQIITITSNWQRLVITGAAAFSSINFLIETRGTFTNNATVDVLLWGAQLVEGTEAKPYLMTTNRQDVPRLDYRNADGTVSSCCRLLLEPQRTNSIRNSTMVGAVAGSPGTLPTFWGSSTGGLTQTIIGLGTENGLQYIDVRFNGNATGGSSLVNLEGTSAIAASNGQTWTQSIYCKLIASPNSPNSYGLFLVQRATGSNVGTFTNTISPTSTLQRFAATNTMNQATITHVQPYFLAGLTIGATYDFTIRIAAPQMELGAYATTFIPTTTAAVTRTADAAFKTGVASLIGQMEGTLFADINVSQLLGNTTRDFLILSSNNTFAASQLVGVSFSALGSNSLRARVFDFGSVVKFEQQYTVPSTGQYKIAFAYKSGDCRMYVNGSFVGTIVQNDAFSISLNQIRTSFDSSTTQFGDGINQAALFPTRLTNAQLAELTTI